MIYTFILVIVVSYLLGSVPFGLVLTKISGLGDLRNVGSGNIGATNVLRVGGVRMAALVWLLDMLKAMVAVFLGRAIGGDVFAVLCGLCAVLGHCFPIWLRFRGGKGVSCLFGVLLATNPFLFVFCGLAWLAVVLMLGYSSLGALAVFALAPIFGFAIDFWTGMIFVVLSLICLWRHRENISRLMRGTESKIVWKWKK